MDLPPELCPHCDQPQPANKMDQHVTTAHANIPACTATIDNETTSGTLQCAFRAWHRKGHGEYGEWHASARLGPSGRMVWNDDTIGATPHHLPD